MNTNRMFQKNRKGHDMRTVAVIVFLCVVSGATGVALADGVACSDLAALSIPDTEITSVEAVAAGPLILPGGWGSPDIIYDLPGFCKVAATLRPRPESEINMEVWMPTEWNGYYHTAGNGGWAGSIDTKGQAEALQSGFATASTDTGHVGGAGDWVFIDDKLRDYSGRAIHETTVVSKVIVQAFYGMAPEASFMTGCSLGGLQTLKAIQEYPEDFDAVVAGSPHFNMTRYNAAQIWPEWVVGKEPEKEIPISFWEWIHAAVLDQCDGSVDGLMDGIVDDPLNCDFDPYSLVCEDGQTLQCLTEKQAEYLQQIYEGPVYQDTGEPVNPGVLLGAEQDLSAFTPQAKPFFFDLHKWLYFGVIEGQNPPDAVISDLTFTDDIRDTEDIIAPVINAENPDLRPYFKRRGKLLLWIGTSEYTNYTAHLAYLDKVRRIVGPTTFDKSVRLFIVPGMGHCGGGECAADSFRKLDAVVDWYDTGRAPDVLDAAHVESGVVLFSRPLCAYPETARYNGEGDPDLAESFTCEPVSPTALWKPSHRSWRRPHHRH